MKAFIVLALVAVAAADVSHIVNQEAAAEILEQNADVFPDQYQYSYKTANGILAQESGSLKGSPEGASIQASGSYSYTAPGGEQISTSYTADENGYHPSGAHLPTPPAPQPIPDYILRSIEYIKAHPAVEEKYPVRTLV